MSYRCEAKYKIIERDGRYCALVNSSRDFRHWRPIDSSNSLGLKGWQNDDDLAHMYWVLSESEAGERINKHASRERETVIWSN